MFEKRDVPFLEFPRGEGPPILMSVKYGSWARLGFGQGHLVPFSGEAGGAFAFGLTKSVVVIWVHLPREGEGGAYCYHAPLGPLTPRAHSEALRQLDCGEHASECLYVVLASGREVTPDEEASVLHFGIHADKIFTYSNALLSQFGASSSGYVGEAG